MMSALGGGVWSSSKTSPSIDGASLPAVRSSDEKLFDVLLAGSVAFWAAAGLTSAAGDSLLVRVPLLSLHLVVALHLALRTKLRRSGGWGSRLASLPALAIAGLAFRLRGPEGSWPPATEALFFSGSLLAIWSFASLGRSFSVLPAVRGIVTRGAYRWLRHPAYAGEILMLLACCLSRRGALGIAVALAALPLVALRIRAEEALLGQSEEYRAYAERVRYRLVPGLW
jgi:protein-S-isoprenylcysteine O-methyltransferase Ste14